MPKDKDGKARSWETVARVKVGDQKSRGKRDLIKKSKSGDSN